MAAAKTATREILVLLRGGRRRKVTGIPANAKITYGPVSPGRQDFSGNGGNALRIYTTTNNQLAVFLNVEEFRDLSLNIFEEKVIAKGSEESERGPKGSRRKSEVEETVEWEEA